MTDITQLIFKSCLWLLAGLFFYYLLSFAKVFLLVHLQPQMLQSAKPPKITAGYLFQQISNAFFTDAAIHRSAFSYLGGKGNKDSWKLLNYKKINFYYNLLDAVAIMFKPFLVIALIWGILKFMVTKRIAYDELQITLAGIQNLIAKINSLPLIGWIEHNRNWIFLTIIILIIAFGLLKKYGARMVNAQKTASALLTILAILSSVSFFGADIGINTRNKSRQLQQLQLEVNTIHENIYREMAEKVVYEDLADAVTENVYNNEQAEARLAAVSDSVFTLITDPRYKSEMWAQLQQLNNDFKAGNSLAMPVTVPVPASPRLLTGYMQEYYRANPQPYTPGAGNTETYMARPEQWQKGKGQTLTAKITAVPDQPRPFSPAKKTEVKNIAKHIVEVFAEELVNKTASLFGLEKLELPKSITQYVAVEKIKKQFITKLQKGIAWLDQLSGNLSEISPIRLFKKIGDNSRQLALTMNRNMGVYNSIIKETVRKQELAVAEQKVNSMIQEQIESIISKYSAEPIYGSDDFVKAVTEGYKEEISLTNMPVEEIRSMIRSKRVNTTILDRVLSRSSTMAMHPGRRETCPICAYKRARRVVVY